MTAEGTPNADSGSKGVSVAGAAFLGIGAMVGAGIFALLGEAGAIQWAAGGWRHIRSLIPEVVFL